MLRVKLYTKTGDNGTTGLFGGQRVQKDDPRIEACGTVDEFCAALGLAVVAAQGGPIEPVLVWLENMMFDLGCDLATPLPSKPSETPSKSVVSVDLSGTTDQSVTDRPKQESNGSRIDRQAAPGSKSKAEVTKAKPCNVPRIEAPTIQKLERHIDQVSETLPPLRQFILPGGSELAARLHLARAVCRRAERRCRTLQRHETINPHVLVCINRVSDLLFALARQANQLQGVPDIPWIPTNQTSS